MLAFLQCLMFLSVMLLCGLLLWQICRCRRRWYRWQIYHRYQGHWVVDGYLRKDVTTGAPWLANISANFWKIQNKPNIIIRGLGEDDYEKPKAKSRDNSYVWTSAFMAKRLNIYSNLVTWQLKDAQRTYRKIAREDGESNFQMNFCRWILTCLFYSEDKPMSTSCKGLLS